MALSYRIWSQNWYAYVEALRAKRPFTRLEMRGLTLYTVTDRGTMRRVGPKRRP